MESFFHGVDLGGSRSGRCRYCPSTTSSPYGTILRVNRARRKRTALVRAQLKQ